LRRGQTGLDVFGHDRTASAGVRRWGGCSDSPTQRGSRYRRLWLRRQASCSFQVLERRGRRKRTRPDVARFGCKRWNGRFLPLHPAHVLTLARRNIRIVAPRERWIPPGFVAAAAKHKRHGEPGDPLQQVKALRKK
jgi:hypothetical protein